MSLPDWANDLLVCPETKSPLKVMQSSLIDENGMRIAKIDHGLIRFGVGEDYEDTRYFRSIGGAHFYERHKIALSMSALDTSVYQRALGHLDPFKHDLVLDLGGGDGRNAGHLLESGFTRLIVTDVAGDALLRFRRRLAARDPALLDRVLLVECDARKLPIREGILGAALAIEVLTYLNEDYGIGVRELRRCLRHHGVAFVSEHDWAASLLTRVMYKGLPALLKNAENRDSWDGVADATVRSRSFTCEELVEIFSTEGFHVRPMGGVPLLSMAIGFLHGLGRLDQPSEAERSQLGDLLKTLSETSAPFRCNIIHAEAV